MTGQNQAGKTVVVTGATSGIGAVVARDLAMAGARVLIVGRDTARTQAALAALPPPAFGAHAAYIADLSIIAQMKRVAAEIATNEPVIDVLINNAGGLFPDRQVTEDGLERTFALNHMSYFAVTIGLLNSLMAAPHGRVVSTASRLHATAKLDFADLQLAGKYSAYAAYGRSKLCNILFTRALARRLSGTAVTANALHPGFVATRFGDDDRSAMGVLFTWMKVLALSPQDGARTTLHVATSEDGGRLNGAYFVKCRPAEPSKAAQNDEDAERLWVRSLELTT
jgi:NAD(P)-dependent dehydrogenase (short-subunit alcohol dehydrogenase family)